MKARPTDASETLLYRSAGIRLSMIGSIVAVSPNHASGMNSAQIT